MLEHSKRIFIQHFFMLIIDIFISFLFLPTFLPFADNQGHSISIQTSFLIILYYLVILSLVNVLNFFSIRKILNNQSIKDAKIKWFNLISLVVAILTITLIGFEVWNIALWSLLIINCLTIVPVLILDIYRSKHDFSFQNYLITVMNQILFVTILVSIFLTFPSYQ